MKNLSALSARALVCLATALNPSLVAAQTYSPEEIQGHYYDESSWPKETRLDRELSQLESDEVLNKYAEFAWLAINQNQAIIRKALSCLNQLNEPHCRQLDSEFKNQIKPKYREMRISLALAKPHRRPESAKVSEQRLAYKIEVNPKHLFGYFNTLVNIDLPKPGLLQPLSDEEIREALEWYDGDKEFCLSQYKKLASSNIKGRNKTPDLANSQQRTQEAYLYNCRDRQRFHYRDVYLGIIDRDPILALIQPRSHDRDYIDVIDYLMALEKVYEATEQLKISLASDSEDQKITEVAFQLLSWKNMLLEFIKEYPQYSNQARALAQSRETQETRWNIIKIVGLIAGGIACHYAVRKIPGGVAAVSTISLTASAACNLSFGLAVNFHFLATSKSRSGKDYLAIFATPQGRLLGEELYRLQKMNELDSAESELFFDIATFAIGTGVPELIRALKPLLGKLTLQSQKLVESLIQRSNNEYAF